ncbi:putative proteasome assembly chaperone 1 [Rosa chinensis]|uniref:Putative proteasome assembly chaperone 1 n=1 Tax=Rosa chinensis TaxID=74649 RepID=A0A2P6R248_ROSCH|nr:uncharacterized protein LOC112200436 [Rosa chinensis]PRQ40513.1 putative proteasome assembly chaperone 1 [Rosa chinensis]
MEDVLTEVPPPSRFFQEDLNNFTPPSPPIPSPFLVFPTAADLDLPLRPSLLIIAISSPSLHLFHTAASKILIGTLILPETSFAGNSVQPSLKDKSCNLYSLDGDRQTLLVSVQCPIAADRCHAVAELLVSQHIVPERVLILDSVQNRNFRGKLSRDEALAFKLETTSERKSKSKSLKLEYLPSASVVDGLGAALLAKCEINKIKAVLCVTWPEFGAAALELIKFRVLPALDLGLSFKSDADDYGSLGQDKDPFDSDLYS